MLRIVAGPMVRCPSESRMNGAMVRGPVGAFAGMASVSRTDAESGIGLPYTDESAVTKLPEVRNPIDRTFTAERPPSERMIDFPTTAIVPLAGLLMRTSAAGTFPTVRLMVSVGDLFSAPSMAKALTVTGVPRGMERGTDTKNGTIASVTALVNVVSNARFNPPLTLTLIDLMPRLSFTSTWKAMTVSGTDPPFDR